MVLFGARVRGRGTGSADTNPHDAYQHALSPSVGGAYDRSGTPEAGGRETQDPLFEIGGRLGLSAVMADGHTVLHMGVSRRGRFPALRELHSGALNRFVPNRGFKPERLLTTEAGATLRLGMGEFQRVGFHNLLEDAVVRITLYDGPRRFMRVNRNELRTTGVEAFGAYARGRATLSASTTLQSVELIGTEAGQKHDPESLPEVFGDLNVRFPVLRGFVGSAGVAYTGAQFAIDALTGESAELEAAAVVSASVSRSWTVSPSWGGRFTSLECRLAVDNAGDAALYEAWGLPGPGRRWRFEPRLR